MLDALAACVTSDAGFFSLPCVRSLDLLALGYPRDAQVRALLGAARAMAGDMPQAVDDLERAVVLDPQFGLAWALKAEQEAYLGRFDAARRSIQRCLDVSKAPVSALSTQMLEAITSFRGIAIVESAGDRERLGQST